MISAEEFARGDGLRCIFDKRGHALSKMRKQTAKRVTSELLKSVEALNRTLRVIQHDCPIGEFKRYQKKFANVLGNIFTGVLLPIYEEHPSLTPPALREGAHSPKVTMLTKR